MAINTVAARNLLCDAYKAACTHAALFNAAGGGSAGTEPTGGSPAYARKAITWGTSSGGSVTGTCTFDVPTGFSVAGFGLFSALAGTYHDGGSLTTQAFASQGTYALTITFSVA